MDPFTLALIGLGAYLLLSKSGTSAVGFVDANGNPIAQSKVGQIVGFNVPGRTTVWLKQTQNGLPQYNGPLTVPMHPYTLLARDLGLFEADVYENAHVGPGPLIGHAELSVLPV